VSDLRRRAFAPGGQVSAEWSWCPGSMAMARRARDSVAALRRSSAGWMPARIGRLSAGVGDRHPIAIRKASLMAGSMRRVRALRPHAGAQYSAVEWTRATAISNVVAPAPSATRDVSFLRSDSMCQRYVSDLSNVSLRYLGSKHQGRILFL